MYVFYPLLCHLEPRKLEPTAFFIVSCWSQKLAVCSTASVCDLVDVQREAKGKREKERYTHLNAEFQRIARRFKKAFLSDQCKEIGKNSRMGKTLQEN